MHPARGRSCVPAALCQLDVCKGLHSDHEHDIADRPDHEHDAADQQPFSGSAWPAEQTRWRETAEGAPLGYQAFNEAHRFLLLCPKQNKTEHGQRRGSGEIPPFRKK